MGGMDLWVSYPLAFKRMDEYINGTSYNDLDTLMAQFHDPSPAFTPSTGSSFLGGQEQSHFIKHWIGEPGTQQTPPRPPVYWPYLTKIDIAGMLRCAFHTSVKIFATARKKLPPNQPTKFHATLWTCSQEVPSSYLAAVKIHAERYYRLPTKAQQKLFRIAVIELDHVVQVLISTPEPMPAELGALHEELPVAHLIPHYRLIALMKSKQDGTPAPVPVANPCGWIQYAHPMKEAYPFPDHDLIKYGERPDNLEFELTVPGRQEIDKTWKVP